MPVQDIPAPMTGTVLEVLVAPGESVTAGQELLVVESMKMEIPLESPSAGRVAEVLVATQDRIEEGQLVLRIES
ncbi:MAG: acetyl-CoA carboxylase biotin carboxyl carrier protein subunit [Dehalococcoidia bacterium]|nr:acetyl-CoA carboxylase biotin carboxyl carrier protein subunit [Dehalococcoidia bacterium]